MADPDFVLARAVWDTGTVTAVLTALGLLGTGAAAMAAGAPLRAARTVLVAVGLIEVLGLGVGLQSVTTISLAGYLIALTLPVGLVWLAVQAVRRYRRLRWAVLATALATAVWGWTTGALRPAALGALATELGQGFAHNSAQLVLVVLLAAPTAGWVVVLLHGMRDSRASRAVGDWVSRHRRGLTVLAAAGPLPYGLIRASWLTPGRCWCRAARQWLRSCGCGACCSAAPGFSAAS